MQSLVDGVIIPAGPADAQALAWVHVTCWRQTYPGLLPQAYLDQMSLAWHAGRWRRQLDRLEDDEVVLAVEGRDCLIGYCAAGLLKDGRPSTAEVFTLYLLRSAQSRGLGRRLMAAAARVMAAKGARSLQLWVLNGNAAARAFYEVLLGRPVAERPVRGWGGGLLETLYRWEDIALLFR